MGVGHRPRYNYVSACLALVLNYGTGAAPNGRGLLLLRPWVCPLPLLVKIFYTRAAQSRTPPASFFPFTCILYSKSFSRTLRHLVSFYLSMS